MVLVRQLTDDGPDFKCNCLILLLRLFLCCWNIIVAYVVAKGELPVLEGKLTVMVTEGLRNVTLDISRLHQGVCPSDKNSIEIV